MRNNGNTIQSVDRALRILECFIDADKELSLTYLAQQLGLNKSTVYGLANTLKNRGYLDQNEENSRYSLGLKLFELGNVMKSHIDIRDCARPYLKQLSEKYAETIHLCIFSQYEAFYIDKVDSPHNMRMYSMIGKRVPLYCTAVGKAILANLDPHVQDAIISRMELKPFTSATITDRESLRKELVRIREQGYSTDKEEIEIGLSCIAAPIFSAKNRVAAAISIAGPTARMTDEFIGSIREEIISTAKLISIRLGYRD